MQRPSGRLSVDIIPQQSPDIADASLHWLFGKDDGYVTRLQEDYVRDTLNDVFTSAKAEAKITREITDWLQSQECDECWAPRTRQPRQTFPTADQILEQLEDVSAMPEMSSSQGAVFESLLRLIALQLLAASYTLLPPSSANHIPLFQQRKERKLVTALRLHSRHRFSPAAGHQARPPSETDPWPGLYTGPSTEEKLAQHITQRRFGASGWTDGPPAIITRGDSRSSLSRESSSSSSELGFFSRLICQAAVPKNYRRKHNTMFLSRKPSKQKRQRRLQPENNYDGRAEGQKVSSQPVQRIPSVHRLRHTQSAPRIAVDAEEEAPVESVHDGKRHGSDPSIGSTLNYSFQIPEIRRTSVTPSVSWCPGSSEEGVMRACGRGDLIAPQDYFDNMPETPDTSRHQQSRWKIPHWRHKYIGPSPPPSSGSSDQSVAESRKSALDYFTDVYTDKHITHQTDDPDLAAEEHSDAGPEIGDDPRLQKMLSNIVTMPDTDDSSDSDVERTKKRKGIQESEATASEVADRFREKTGDGLDHSTAKLLW